MKARITINLLPPEFRPPPLVRWQLPYLAFIYTFGLVVCIGIVFVSFSYLGRLKEQITELERKVNVLKPWTERYDEYKTLISGLQNRKALFVYLERNYVDWPLFLREIAPLVPPYLWLISITSDVEETAVQSSSSEASEGKSESAPLAHQGTMVLVGRVAGYSLTPLSTFLSRLRAHPLFRDPTLLNVELEEESEFGVNQKFVIDLKVAPPLVSPEVQAAKPSLPASASLELSSEPAAGGPEQSPEFVAGGEGVN